MITKPYWMEDAQLPRFGRLDRDLSVDVLVVGAGITGVTAAYLLKKAGRTVALIDRDRCLHGDTAHTTAHLSYVIDLRLSELVKHFGRRGAQAVWDAGRTAISQIHEIIRDEQIECDFNWVPGFFHASLRESGDPERQALQDEAALAAELGFPATYREAVPLVRRPGLEVGGIARFHPLKYLTQLIQRIPGEGSYVFEETMPGEYVSEPRSIKCNGHALHCNYTVMATHVPHAGFASAISTTLLHTKLYPYTSYVIGAWIPAGKYPEGCFWDTTDPYYYLRIDRRDDHDYAIFGGEDHKTGQRTDTQVPFARLEDLLLQLLPDAEVEHRWSGQVIETNDGLPFMGEIAERQFIATGYSGNGLTFGTCGAMMARDAALGQSNLWQDVFHPARKKFFGGAWDYVRENFDYPYYMVRDRIAGGEQGSPDDLEPGRGCVLNVEGQRVAAYRDSQGNLTTLSPTCTHMGCLVHWNEAERTWDCPCHGSRFEANGKVIAGPAETSLHPVEIAALHPAEAK